MPLCPSVFGSAFSDGIWAKSDASHGRRLHAFQTDPTPLDPPAKSMNRLFQSNCIRVMRMGRLNCTAAAGNEQRSPAPRRLTAWEAKYSMTMRVAPRPGGKVGEGGCIVDS